MVVFRVDVVVVVWVTPHTREYLVIMMVMVMMMTMMMTVTTPILDKVKQ